MTTNSKQELISKIVTLLNELIDVEEKSSMKSPKTDKKIEMLTIIAEGHGIHAVAEHADSLRLSLHTHKGIRISRYDISGFRKPGVACIGRRIAHHLLLCEHNR